MIGVDEVGRGAWAGPLLIVAARLKQDQKHVNGLNDSKKLSRIKREKVAPEIKAAYQLGYGWVDVSEIDRLGLSIALREGARRAVQAIASSHNDAVMIDGVVNLLKDSPYIEVQTMKKADEVIPEVSAASIVAKVARDAYMRKIAKEAPEYSFDTNVGYGTQKHTQAIIRYGLSKYHRQSFSLPKVGIA